MREMILSIVTGFIFNSLAICLLAMQPTVFMNTSLMSSGFLSQYVVLKVWVLKERLHVLQK
jgi:hypothetical protein